MPGLVLQAVVEARFMPDDNRAARNSEFNGDVIEHPRFVVPMRRFDQHSTARDPWKEGIEFQCFLANATGERLGRFHIAIRYL